jgi:hypothetical protein
MYDTNAFLLERYKYVLLRKQALNEATFKIAAIYQAVLLALGLGQYNVLVLYQSGALSAVNARLYSNLLLAMLFVLSALVLTLLVGGIFAWINYRNDEAEIELKVAGIKKDRIKMLSIFSWYETYIGAIVLVVLVGWTFIIMKFITPILL